jgi:hypothetical protein
LAKKQGTIGHRYARLKPAHQTLKITRNFFSTLRDLEVEEAPETGGDEESEILQRIGKDRPSPIIIMTKINMLNFQGEIKATSKGNFELGNTKRGTRVITREMADYLAIKSN